ncbi:MAG: ATP-binding protein [Planctomycetota bacterium]|nr:MAG: ATP-binding protein [Planctomycetota bacterium]REJ97564.1 MAG: ATP-binding protein [Planctomycetota bacterium]REK26909.1 MAG: ATP-binding protein [Planctomycetota bacterium]REK35398.1 MAG: ATP-binding protein [Planctomycetota bacterium]
MSLRNEAIRDLCPPQGVTRATNDAPVSNSPTAILDSPSDATAESATDACRESAARRVLQFELENDPAGVSAVVNAVVEEVRRISRPDGSEDVRLRVALEEALVNAVVHGNLEVSSDLREAGDGSYERLIDRRRHQAKYRDRRVRLTCELRRDEAVFVVRDEGGGFDADRLPDPRESDRMQRAGGRGVFLMRTLMDAVEYSVQGTVVTMRKRWGATK